VSVPLKRQWSGSPGQWSWMKEGGRALPNVWKAGERTQWLRVAAKGQTFDQSRVLLHTCKVHQSEICRGQWEGPRFRCSALLSTLLLAIKSKGRGRNVTVFRAPHFYGVPHLCDQSKAGLGADDEPIKAMLVAEFRCRSWGHFVVKITDSNRSTSTAYNRGAYTQNYCLVILQGWSNRS
jgi:hypothetical protein